MRGLLVALLTAPLLALPAVAQQGGTIQPGMSAAEVRAVFGAPAAVRQAGEWSYLYYLNSCPRTCGSDDVVFLQDDRVVAAVLRARHRRFAGPAASAALREVVEMPPVHTAPGPAPRGGQPAGQPGIRLEPPAARTPATDLGVIRGRDPAPPIPGDAVSDTVVADTLAADTAMDRQRQLREQRVEPRTLRSDTVAPAPGTRDRQQEREQRIEPRTVRPRPSAAPPSR